MNSVEKLKLKALNRMSVEEFKISDKKPVVVLLDNVRSMHNVGAVFRTSDAFAIVKIFLCGITPSPPHREIQKTALGATESVDWEYCNSSKKAIEILKEQGFTILGVEQVLGSISLNDFSFNKTTKIALIFGNEVEGITEEVLPLIDAFLEIPQQGTKHSLNVSICAGIVLWEAFKNL